MLRLVIGNKAYSSWSLRGWLAVRQSGLPFEEMVVPLYDDDWPARRDGPEIAPGGGKLPILWDGGIAIWDSLAILEYLADRVGRARFWPEDDAARGLARAMVAEMHSGFAPLRRALPMNVRRTDPPRDWPEDVAADIARVLHLWTEARTRFGGAGDFLFGAFGAADIMFAPVVTRFATYSVPLPPVARAYADAVTAHPFMQDWLAAAAAEPWVLARYERDGAA
jgi:glutathione S-transferase